MTERDRSLTERAASILADAREEKREREGTDATESLDGWRSRLEEVPNWMLNLPDVLMLVLGLWMVLAAGGALVLPGVVIGGIGAIGLGDAVWQRAGPVIRGGRQ